MICFNFNYRSWVGLFLLAFTSYAFSSGITPPPNDDSDKSSVRVTTNWVTHSLGKAGCLEHAKTILAKAQYYIDTQGPHSVWGLSEGKTVTIRCDYEGVAFFVIAYRHRPDQETQNKLLNDLTKAF